MTIFINLTCIKFIMEIETRNISRKTSIAGIETLIVDPHNQVLPLWYEKKNGKPFVLIHVDSHHDMFCESNSFYYQRFSFKTKPLEEYSKKVSCGGFISGAIYDKIIGPVIHIAPKYRGIRAFSSSENEDFLSAPEIDKNRFGLKWKYLQKDNPIIPISKTVSEEDLFYLLKDKDISTILDIDLDAFHLYREDDINFDFSKRISYTEDILREIPKPEAITIARSQTPVFIDPKIVDKVEDSCLDMLKMVYY
jgi:hypothetical protein